MSNFDFRSLKQKEDARLADLAVTHPVVKLALDNGFKISDIRSASTASSELSSDGFNSGRSQHYVAEFIDKHQNKRVKLNGDIYSFGISWKKFEFTQKVGAWFIFLPGGVWGYADDQTHQVTDLVLAEKLSQLALATSFEQDVLLGKK